jgi:pteridine reductase
MAQELRGKTALVTGAARRIGRTTAQALAAEGVNIVVHYHRSQGEAVALCDELTSLGIKAWPVQADFRDQAQLAGLCETAATRAGHLDMLVNNASIFPRDTLEDVSLESMVANLAVNAWAPLALSRDFAACAGRGSIINLIDSRIDDFDWTHVGYMLSKHVLAALTAAMALKYAPHLRVNGVAPGLILPPAGESREYLESRQESVPLKQHGSPQDVAEAVIYLAKSEFVTGELVYVDGGRHLREGSFGPNPD